MLGLLLLLTLACTRHYLVIQPHMGTVAQREVAADFAGIYIPNSTLNMEYETRTFFGGKTLITLGTAVKDLSQETFAPFYRRTFYQARRDYVDIDHLIEVSIDNFKMTEGLDSHVKISIAISDEELTIWSGSFEGKGSGTAAAGLGDSAAARSQLSMSASAAFLDAFEKAREDYSNFLADKNKTE
jgi:hypothetical protein